MFDQFKKIAELKKLQDQMKQEIVTVEQNGVTVLMNGAMEVMDIKLNPSLDIEAQQKAVKDAINKARNDVQQKMAKSLMGSGLM
jgi:DNA-binding protein YbaB